jgi:alpha-glucosidase
LCDARRKHAEGKKQPKSALSDWQQAYEIIRKARNYYSEEECTEFIASVPTSWDETVMVSGEIGEYVAIARRKGEKWYVGAITNWTPREMDLELGFITSASVMTVFHDGANADKVARDYMKEEEDFPENGRVRIKMAPGGGWAAIIK